MRKLRSMKGIDKKRKKRDDKKSRRGEEKKRNVIAHRLAKIGFQTESDNPIFSQSYLLIEFKLTRLKT